MADMNWVFLIAKIVILVLILVHVVPIMLIVERRGSALMQGRLGPNRIGPFGVLQALADALKFIFKEEMVPTHVAKFYYLLAPIVSLIPAFMTFAVIPFAAPTTFSNLGQVHFQVANLDVGILYIFAVASLGVYGIIMAGWSSNNKYALLGSLRSSSQMISYELSLGLSVVPILMIYQGVNLGEIAAQQAQTFMHLGPLAIPKWGILTQPIGFIIFVTAAFAETNRLPFDLPEGESEIVAGYHLEYGALKFALLMMAEFVNMTTASGLMATLYFGGYHFPGMEHVFNLIPLTGDALEWAKVAIQAMTLLAKVAFFMWFFVWVRWTLPRFRYDQLMDLGWRVMLPLSLVNIFITGALIYFKVI